MSNEGSVICAHPKLDSLTRHELPSSRSQRIGLDVFFRSPVHRSEIPCSSYANDVPLRIDGLDVIRLDFKGGWKVRVKGNIDSNLGGVKLEVLGFEWSADSSVLGRVTISQGDMSPWLLSLVEAIKTMPPVFRNTMFVDLTMTIERPPGGRPPLVLKNVKTAAVVNNNLQVFPPQGGIYQLQNPVDLTPVGAPNQVVATLQAFPLTVSHNP